MNFVRFKSSKKVYVFNIYSIASIYVIDNIQNNMIIKMLNRLG